MNGFLLLGTEMGLAEQARPIFFTWLGERESNPYSRSQKVKRTRIIKQCKRNEVYENIENL